MQELFMETSSGDLYRMKFPLIREDDSNQVFDMKLEEVEKLVILGALRAKSYNRTRAAQSLGIGIRTLQRKLKQYGLSELGLDPKYLKHRFD